MKTLRGAVIGLLSATLWCGCLAPPNITHPGSAEYQQKRAEKFDPYPETDPGGPDGRASSTRFRDSASRGLAGAAADSLVH